MKEILAAVLFAFLQIIALYAQDKAGHAEPLVNDFTTDLSSPKGEGQANFMVNYNALQNGFDIRPQVEIEFAPLKKFGLEVQVPFSFSKQKGADEEFKTRLPAMQWAAQFTIFTRPEANSSLAISYRNAYTLKENRSSLSLAQISHLPYLLYAKSLAERYYFTGNAGPEIVQAMGASSTAFNFLLGGSFHYKFMQINYIGFEYAQKIMEEESEVMFYPQFFNEFTDKLKAGAAIGIPLTNFDTKFSALVRVSVKL